MKIRVAGVNLADAMLAHQRGRVGIMENVAAQVGNFRQHFA